MAVVKPFPAIRPQAVKAAEIAVQTVKDYLNTDTRIEKVVFNVFKQEDYDIYRELLG